MRRKNVVPSYQAIMPHVVYALKSLDGKASNNQVLYKVLLDLDIKPTRLKEARNNVNWAGVYLRKFGILRTDTKKGEWILESQYLQMDDEEIRKFIRKEYKALYNI